MTSGSRSLSATSLLSEILSGELSAADLEVAFLHLVELPITAELIADCVGVLREKMVPVKLSEEAIDTCGTGGSGFKTINTSTLTALIVATAGGRIAKHGNRSASGNCGCFDLLEALGIRINLTPEQEAKVFEELGIVFLFAPLHHPTLKFVSPLRKQYGKKTIFNLLGPLCNPAGVTRQLIGTGDKEDAQLIAQALQKLGSFGSKVVRGYDGLDEVTNTTDTMILDIKETGISQHVFSPSSLSISLASNEEITGGTVEENRQTFLTHIQGFGDAPKKNLILLNAAYAIQLGGLVSTLKEAFVIARETLESGKVYNLFQEYKELTSAL